MPSDNLVLTIDAISALKAWLISSLRDQQQQCKNDPVKALSRNTTKKKITCAFSVETLQQLSQSWEHR